MPAQPSLSKSADPATVPFVHNLAAYNRTEVRRELVRRGHRLSDTIGRFGGYQAIMFDQEQCVYYGASESRKDGQAAGY
mgnify:CR=1 FL=1